MDITVNSGEERNLKYYLNYLEKKDISELNYDDISRLYVSIIRDLIEDKYSFDNFKESCEQLLSVLDKSRDDQLTGILLAGADLEYEMEQMIRTGINDNKISNLLKQLHEYYALHKEKVIE